MHSRAVLLKTEELSSVATGAWTEMIDASVNAWVKFFKSEGINGLESHSGRDRKPNMASNSAFKCFLSALAQDISE